MNIKNPDVAAVSLMLVALLSEAITYLASSESLLAQLPPWLGPFVLAVAAVIRYRREQAKLEPAQSSE